MSAPRPLEDHLLDSARKFLEAAAATVEPALKDEYRLQILEAAASQLGGLDFSWYQSRFNGHAASELSNAEEQGALLASLLQDGIVNPSMALASLARPHLEQTERRSSGVYYTDFRLAEYLARPLAALDGQHIRIVDPASGTGILLVAAALRRAFGQPSLLGRIIGSELYGADLSARSLRGTRLALASLTDDTAAVISLNDHLKQADSLITGKDLWESEALEGFSAVIANPPWEKLRVTRHEHLKAQGIDRHYGAGYSQFDPLAELETRRNQLGQYVRRLESIYSLQGSGDPDLYKLFIELATDLAMPGGMLSLLVPAGLMRSKGTRPLREYLFASASDLSVTVLHNHARFFAIDTRFKFLTVHATLVDGRHDGPITLKHATGDHSGIAEYSSVTMVREDIDSVRPDLSVPEVRGADEWSIFKKMTEGRLQFGSSEGPWRPQIVREVDMTLDRRSFAVERSPNYLPLIEGRMVHQYRYRAKQHRSGTGRRATWVPNAPGTRSEMAPQFWYPIEELSEPLRKRISSPRAAFCDISGQTNERTMLAAVVPSDVVCGNKVPTIVFGDQDGSPSDRVAYCWIAIANSIPFDWYLRRIVTTTVNFFLLLDIPMPDIVPLEAEGARLAELASEIQRAEEDWNDAKPRPDELWELAERRAEIDVRVARAYGLNWLDLKTILADFDLLDGAQTPLPGDRKSTVTRDVILSRAASALEGGPIEIGQYEERVHAARELGAVPYIPTGLQLRGRLAGDNG